MGPASPLITGAPLTELLDDVVVDPPSTGNSSAFGTRCCLTKGFFSTRGPLDLRALERLPGSVDCERLELAVPFVPRRG